MASPFRTLAIGMKTIYSLALVIVSQCIFAGCTSEKTGMPAGKAWYQEGKSAQETMRDLAACQNEALAYGRSFAMGNDDGAGRALALGMINASAETSRENKIVSTCMEAKGYSMIDKNSPLLLTTGLEPPTEADAKAANDLLGHWRSVAFKGNAIGDGVEKLELTFLPNNRLSGITIAKGKTYIQSARYTVRGDKLIVSEPNSPTESQLYSLVGDHLVITYGAGQAEVIFQKVETIP